LKVGDQHVGSSAYRCELSSYYQEKIKIIIDSGTIFSPKKEEESKLIFQLEIFNLFCAKMKHQAHLSGNNLVNEPFGIIDFSRAKILDTKG
jgi:hypothetical protein